MLTTGSGYTVPGAKAAEHSPGLTEPDPALPSGMSLWALLDAEADDAAAHAGFAVNHPTNLDNIQRHTRHVRHLIDPAAEPNRPMPGREQGVAPTARIMRERLDSDAQGLDQESRRIVEDTLRRTLGLSDGILENCAAIVAASSAEDAIALARANKTLLEIMRDGNQETGPQPGLTLLRRVLNAPD